MSYSQADRTCRVFSLLGPDALLIERFSGQEAISSLFTFHLDLLSESEDLSFKSIVGQALAVSMKLADGQLRWFHGFVSRFEQGAAQGRFVAYRAEVVPWLWFLGRRSNCRIFQHLSVPDIVKKLFAELGFSDFKLELSGAHPAREYCVQYRESDLQFVCRLLEEEGIGYFFEHAEKSHTLVLFDGPTAHPPCLDEPAIYRSASDQGSPSGDVRNMYFSREVRSGAHAATDFNFEQPSVSLLSKVASSECMGSNAGLEVYDYPGNFALLPDGGSHVKRRMEAEECASVRAHGESQLALLTPGYQFILKGHYRKDCNEAHLVTSVTHRFSEGVAGEVGTAGRYSNTFSCLPHRIPYRSLRTTPRPIVHGAQTATVVGASGKEIDVDKHGRVVVQFHWDREGRHDEQSSCRVRVAQNWAGKGWGWITHPRIGQEVLVEFLEGDPDRPIVTGRVHNAEQLAPYALPAKDTQMGIRSRSSPGGAASNFNELRFEDRKGEEEVYLQAERNLKALVKRDETWTIQGSRTVTLQEGHDTLTIVKGDLSVSAPAGEHSTRAIDIVVDGQSSIRLRCGGSTIEMTPTMIQIQAPLVKIN